MILHYPKNALRIQTKVKIHKFLDHFEKFASLNGPNFYNLPPNKEKLKLVSRPNKIVEFIDVVEEENIIGKIKPFHAGETLQWQVDGLVS